MVREDCGDDPYVIMADNCEYVDQQTLKLQESPEVVPTGEMPRNILLIVDRYLVDKVTPGTRVSVVGISSLFNGGMRQQAGANALRSPYIKVLGIQIDNEGGGRTNTIFTPQEEEDMQRLARDPDIYEKIARSIAPQISGDYTVDIKKALACLLMGGSRKILPDGVKLRGDINILLMGDPSTAKSQFLKFIEKVAPVGVYTSGKGSSAAGLTASVIKDARGEFFLESGAMVLADGGVICIDEVSREYVRCTPMS
jgi:DNA replication licensing factor MCM5